MTRYGTARSKGGTACHQRTITRRCARDSKRSKPPRPWGRRRAPAPCRMPRRSWRCGGNPWVWRRSPWSRSTAPVTTFGGDAFSRGFYPILPADTEFAAKWSSPVPHPPGGGHPGPCQGGGVPQPLLCDGGPQAGQRAEVFRRYYYPGHCHPPAAQAV